jgi:hypothetical protein
MTDSQYDDLVIFQVEYDAPVAHPQAHCGIAFEPLDLVAKRKRIDGQLNERPFDPFPNLDPSASNSLAALVAKTIVFAPLTPAS